MVNVEQYQIVSTGSTVAACEANYRQALAENKLIDEDEAEAVPSGQESISMIFQSFNLLMQRTALGNVCFPLELPFRAAEASCKRSGFRCRKPAETAPFSYILPQKWPACKARTRTGAAAKRPPRGRCFLSAPSEKRVSPSPSTSRRSR